MKIETLQIQNFKGIKDIDLDLSGRSATILGTNGAGKTTIADAWGWLWTEKDSLGSSVFEPRALDAEGRVMDSDMEPSVEAVIRTEGTRSCCLKKVWRSQKNRQGSLTGNTADFYVDGALLKRRSEYQAVLDSLVPEERFKVLSSPLFFSSQLPWQRRREILLEVCGGDLTDGEIIGDSPELVPLLDILQARFGAEMRPNVPLAPTVALGSILAEEKKQASKAKNEIKPSIKEVLRSRPEGKLDAKEYLGAELQRLAAYISSLQRERAQIEAGGWTSDRRRELAEVEAEIIKSKTEWAEDISKIFAEKQEELGGLRDKESKARREAEAHRTNAALNSEHIAGMEKTLTALREKYRQVQSAPGAGPTKCPTCAKPYLEEERLLARAAILDEINQEGKAIKERKETALAETKKQQYKIEECDRKAQDLQNQIIALEDEIKEIKARPSPISGDLLERQEALRKALTEPGADKKKLERIDHELGLNEKERESVRNELALVKRQLEADIRLAELKAEELRLAGALEDIERQLHLLEQFTRAKVGLLDERINSHFRVARFRMFEEHLNGGLTPCCEVLLGGIPFNSNLNGAHKTLVGMDIINTLSRHWKVSVPIFVDDAANIVIDLPEIDAQVIRLVARKGDTRELTMELEGEHKQ